MGTKNEETKKPFYKKGWFIVIVVIVIIAVISGMGEKEEKLVWSEIELSEFIPEVENKYGEITTNRSNLAIIDISKITKKEYKDYVQKCIDNGYTIDLEYEQWDTVYGAFNEEGYSIRISYLESEEEMGITLKTPEKDTMKEIEWPASGLGAMLPVPKSNLGDISWNNSESFIIHIGNTTIDDYNEYVKKCEDNGFIIDYSKGDKSYSAENSEGYKVHLMYLGANVVEISLKAPKETKDIVSTTTDTITLTEEENTENKTTNENNSSNSNELGKEFQEAMDSYEEFMNEYVDFMKKYANSAGTDMSLIYDYTNYVSKYAEVCEDFAKWEDEEMNTAETAYYIEVQARVNKKLLEVAQ